MASPTLPTHKQALLSTCLSAHILTFGTFTLNSGRISPYFFNAGHFSTASQLALVSTSYASTIASTPPLADSFDIVFGPAYKGIPFATVAATGLLALDAEKYGHIGYAFNRQEAKDHGEGGVTVGAGMKGKRVLVVDDVMTAGTAVREAVEIVKNAGGSVVGVVVMLDRQERVGEGEVSAVQSVARELGVPVVAILTLEDIIGGVDGEEKLRMEEYRARYGAAD